MREWRITSFCTGLCLLAIVVIFFGQTSYADEKKTSKLKISVEAFDTEYVIGPGDVLEINIWKEEDLTRNVSVRIDGRISLPLLGDVIASGKTITELSKDLESKFKEIITEPTVSVMLLASKSWRYYVVGQVKQSGEYTIDYPITALQAIAKCGGFSEWAKTDKIKIVRTRKGRDKIITFDFEALSEKDDLNQELMLLPGDTIIVP